ncbi:site-specific integrase [Haloarcula sp. CBA1131]|uniref:tyrosine-type recombinase/integrase n=1 Tax=Haloarcula sp. CBA1131 TaxID=1853686 RepID=UPI00124423D9|nr:site-specific integrase [Haloarcula sp. CBA1131]KAA9406247.1 site-specific integrase [Haloarcula sp. CBA1131]
MTQGTSHVPQGLESLEPEKAVELYLAQREEDSSERTVQAHWYRLKHFVRWCEQENVTDMNELSGRKLYEFRVWRRDDGDLNTVSLRTQLSTLRAFIRFCESIDGVEKELHDKVVLPTLDDGEDARDDTLEGERAQKILSHLRKFEYASRKHVLALLLWRTSARMGSLVALDVQDFDGEKERLHFRHRPDTGTALKNKSGGERIVALKEETCDVLEDWITHSRPDVTDENGRKPLLATEKGRISESNMRALSYHITRPCYYGDGCQCEDKYSYSYASKCEHSRSPHCWRRGSLTHLLRNDVPKAVVSDRGDVSPDVLDEHYNQMTQEEKAEQRRDYLEGL